MLLLKDDKDSLIMLDVSETVFQQELELVKYSVEHAENLTMLFKHTPFFILYIGKHNVYRNSINIENHVHETDTVERMATRMIRCKKVYIVYDCEIIMHGEELTMTITRANNVNMGAQANTMLRKYLIDDILKDM